MPHFFLKSRIKRRREREWLIFIPGPRIRKKNNLANIIKKKAVSYYLDNDLLHTFGLF